MSRIKKLKGCSFAILPEIKASAAGPTKVILDRIKIDLACLKEANLGNQGKTVSQDGCPQPGLI